MGSTRTAKNENSKPTIEETIDSLPNKNKGYPEILSALALNEKSQWTLARAYFNEVAPGMPTVQQADYEAMAQWLTANGSRVPTYNTMRHARSVAAFWPDTAVMPSVGFSVHAELQKGQKNFRTATALAKKVASSMGKRNKPAPLSAITVNAVRVAQGRAPVVNKSKGSSTTKGKAQTGASAIPIVANNNTPTEKQDSFRKAMGLLTRAVLQELSTEEWEGLTGLLESFNKRIQTEQVRRNKLNAPANKNGKATGTAKNVRKSPAGVR